MVDGGVPVGGVSYVRPFDVFEPLSSSESNSFEQRSRSCDNE